MSRTHVAVSAAATLTALALGGAVLAGSADAGGTEHTLHFNAKTKFVVKVDSRAFVSAVRLSPRHLTDLAKRNGVATFSCHAKTPKAATLHCETSIALPGGILLGTSTVSYSDNSLAGVITTGNGSFAGAHGTIKGVGTSTNHSIVTVTYTN